MNNLTSLTVVLAALSASWIFRLTKTWGTISVKDKQSFDDGSFASPPPTLSLYIVF